MSNEPVRVGDYEILNTLGAGGMGQVYRVRNVISDRIEAMKILLPSLTEHKDVAERFLREIKLVASLHHPNIANLCTAMTVSDRLVMVMEYVDGQSFSELLAHGPVPARDALNYFDQALAALGYAHSKGIVHRDLKPGNIMLTEDGVVKLMDFGIARNAADRALTQTGSTIGTVCYMSPEQIAGKGVDARSDLYSMGIFFYETLTGQQPFKGDSDYDLMVAHMQQTPRRPIEMVPGLPPKLNEVIMKLLAKAPADRFQTAEDVRTEIRSIEGFSGEARGLARPSNSPATAVTEVQRHATMVEGLAGSRQATMVEGFAPPPPQFMPVATPQSGMVVQDPYPGRRMTEVAPAPMYGAPAPAALVVQKKGFARNPALYVVGGLALTATAIAVPVVLTRKHPDTETKQVLNNTAPPVIDSASSPPRPHEEAKNTTPSDPGKVNNLAQAQTVPQGRPDLHAAGKIDTPKVIVVHDGMNGQPQPQPQPPAISAEVKAQLDQEELHIDQLSSRASAINNSLNTMQRSMANDGLSMRGDIVSKQSSMNNNLTKARQALTTNDAQRASRFASLAETDVTQLESFLGR